MQDRVAFMVHVITGPIGHLSDFLELLPFQAVSNVTGLLQNWRKDELFSLMEIQQGKSNNTIFESEIVDIL